MQLSRISFRGKALWRRVAGEFSTKRPGLFTRGNGSKGHPFSLAGQAGSGLLFPRRGPLSCRAAGNIGSEEKIALNNQVDVGKDGTQFSIKNVMEDSQTGRIKVFWSEKELGCSDYPYVWLRDNCQCRSCFHPVSQSRTTLMKDLNLDVFPKSVLLGSAGDSIEIIWSDGHRSCFLASWLKIRSFRRRGQPLKPNSDQMERVYWDSELMKRLPQFNFGELLQEDCALLRWMHQLEKYGFVIVNEAPVETGQVRRLAERVAFIKKTHYGEDFDVIAKNDPSNVAYSSGPLQLHTDLPYYDYKPGVQFIHCIVQYEGEGGESHVADAAYVALELKKIEPDMFGILSRVPVNWMDTGSDATGEYLKVLQKPVLCLNENGDVTRINFSQPQRDSLFTVPVDDVDLWYRAVKTYHDMLYDPKYCLYFKMEPGTIMTLDNLRVVHGRSGYRSGFGERYVQGCYLDWDEVRSKRRVLERRMALDAAN